MMLQTACQLYTSKELTPQFVVTSFALDVETVNSCDGSAPVALESVRTRFTLFQTSLYALSNRSQKLCKAWTLLRTSSEALTSSRSEHCKAWTLLQTPFSVPSCVDELRLKVLILLTSSGSQAAFCARSACQRLLRRTVALTNTSQSSCASNHHRQTTIKISLQLEKRTHSTRILV